MWLTTNKQKTEQLYFKSQSFGGVKFIRYDTA